MKRLIILFVCLCITQAFGMEVVDRNEPTSSWVPTWSNVRNYLGFGLSSALPIPTESVTKAAYGAFSLALGVSELYVAETFLSYRQPNINLIQNAPADLLICHGASTFLYGTSILADLVWDTLFGLSQQSKKHKVSVQQTTQMGLQVVAFMSLATMIEDMGYVNILRSPVLLISMPLLDRFMFNNFLRDIFTQKNKAPLLDRWYHNFFIPFFASVTLDMVYLFYLLKIPNQSILSAHPQHHWSLEGGTLCSKSVRNHEHGCLPVRLFLTLLSKTAYPSLFFSVNNYWKYASVAGFFRDLKDTCVLLNIILNSLETHEQRNLEKNVNVVRPLSRLEQIRKAQKQAQEKEQNKRKGKGKELKENHKIRSEHALHYQQEGLSAYEEQKETYTTTWREEQDQLRKYGITIQPGPYGTTILRCGDVVKTIKTPQRDEAKVSGNKAATIHSLYPTSLERLSNTYQIASLAFQATLNPPQPYVFTKEYQHEIIQTLTDCRSLGDVTITRNSLKNLLKFLDLKEREERKAEITEGQDLGYYYDKSRGHGGHAMYSLGYAMGGITLSKPKHGRNPKNLTPEQVKDLFDGLVQKGLVLER